MRSSEVLGVPFEHMFAANKAEEVYKQLGYSTFNLRDPDLLTILSNANTSQVQLYDCHGNPSYIKFKSGGLATGPSRTIICYFHARLVKLL